MQFRVKDRHGRQPHTLTRVERTSISFSSEDLAALARLIQVGRLLLREEQRPLLVIGD